VSGFSRTSEKGRTAQREDVNRRDVDGSTPLQWAVYQGDVAATAPRR
jgi:ankyrin repeat protein